VEYIEQSPYIKLPPRVSDQKVFVADISKAKNLIGWKPLINKEKGIVMMLNWINDNLKYRVTLG
jgi:CDP-paratose 2-epimerase